MAISFEDAKQYLRKRISQNESYEDLLRFPRFFEIETVHSCNARCQMCTINDWETKRKPITKELFDKIADEIIANADQVKRVSLYRDGEPLLDKHLPDRISKLKEGGVSDVTIATNVSLLNEKNSKNLLDAGLDIIILSIDSLKKQVHESIRKGLHFEEVMDNAHRFISLRNRYNKKTRIWVRMVRQDSNKNEWKEYKEYWEKRLSDTDRVYFHDVFNWGDQLTNFKPVSSTYEIQLPCVALWSLMVIFSDGTVPLCNIDYKGLFKLGDINKQSIAEVWESSRLNGNRKMHLNDEKGAIKICRRCNVWDEPSDVKKISKLYAKKFDIN